MSGRSGIRGIHIAEVEHLLTGQTLLWGRGGTVSWILVQKHRSLSKHQPINIDIRKFIFYSLNGVQRRLRPFAQDAAQCSWSHSEELSEVLLVHMLGLHQLSDSIFHISLL